MEGSIHHERNPRRLCFSWIGIPSAILLLLGPFLAHGQTVRTEISRGWPAQQGQDPLNALGHDSNWPSTYLPGQDGLQVNPPRRHVDTVPLFRLVSTSSRRTTSSRSGEFPSGRRVRPGVSPYQPTENRAQDQVDFPNQDSNLKSPHESVPHEPQLTSLRQLSEPFESNVTSSRRTASDQYYDFQSARRMTTGPQLAQPTQWGEWENVDAESNVDSERHDITRPIAGSPVLVEPSLTSLQPQVDLTRSFQVVARESRHAAPAGTGEFETAQRVTLGVPLDWPTQQGAPDDVGSTYHLSTWPVSSPPVRHEPQLTLRQQDVAPIGPLQMVATGWPPSEFDRPEEFNTAPNDRISAPDSAMMSDPAMTLDPMEMSSVRAALKDQANDLFFGLSSVLSAPVFDMAVRNFLADEDPAADGQPSTPGLATAMDGPPRLADDGEVLGQAPQDNSLQFLRRVAVLLPRGDWQADIGLTYAHFEQDFFDPIAAVNATVRQRLMVVPLAVRYGLTDRIQTFVALPFGWASGEISTLGQDDFSNSFGIGDVRAGATVLFREASGCGCDPTITGTFAFTAPTGQQSYLGSLLFSPDINLGAGFWAASWNVLFIHSYDPIVTFYGFGSRHRFDRMMEGFHVSPGDEYLYQFGVGFAVNESVTLSTVFLGQYVTEPYLDGARLEGLIREPLRLRFAATIVDGCHCRIMEPFATVGMTESAPSAHVGIVWTY